MYKATLRVLLSGLAPETEDAIKKVAPQERFSHEFAATSSLDADILSGQHFSVIIFTDASMGKLRLSDVRRIAGKDARCIIITPNPQSLPAEELSLLDSIWPSPLTPALATILFSRLVSDIKARKDAWMEHAYWQTTINSSPDLIWYKDKVGAHVEVNDAFCKAVGKDKDDIRGRGHYYIWGLTKEQYAKGEFVCNETEEAVMREQRPMVFDEHVLSKTNGMRQLQTYKSPLFDEDGSILGTVGVAMDVTKEREYQDKLLHAAQYDPLTNLPNRRYFFERVEAHAGEPKFLLSLDIDNFKHFNDDFGHLVGDDVLRLFAGTMRETFLHGFSTRFGGDEFLVIYSGKHSLENIRNGAEEFRRTLQERSSVMPSGVVGASIGIACDTDGNLPIDKLYQRADAALYSAKRQGKDKIVVWNEGTARTVKKER